MFPCDYSGGIGGVRVIKVIGLAQVYFGRFRRFEGMAVSLDAARHGDISQVRWLDDTEDEDFDILRGSIIENVHPIIQIA